MSQLLGIIQRLQSLEEQSKTATEPPHRYFELNGEKKCSVTYFNKTESFTLEVYIQGEKPKQFQFDNIDMIAIEIFDLLDLSNA